MQHVQATLLPKNKDKLHIEQLEFEYNSTAVLQVYMHKPVHKEERETSTQLKDLSSFLANVNTTFCYYINKRFPVDGKAVFLNIHLYTPSVIKSVTHQQALEEYAHIWLISLT